jgi:ubiquinone/menaquinone biosynthesis C-methylase UbiE
MKDWETNSEPKLVQLLVGDWYGKNPENNLDMIREDKARMASWILEKVQPKASDTVLEIGSGMGFGSKYIAKRVKRLFCCDISESFLAYARQECRDVENISFHKIERQGVLPFDDNFFDCVYSDAVFIHLNLYDIFWYLSAFRRVVKPDGIVWFNIMNTSPLKVEKLAEMAEYYRDDKSCITNLLCWNSQEAVVNAASHFGFELVSSERYDNINLKFRKVMV